MISISKDSFVLSSDYDGSIKDTVLRRLSFGSWSNVPKKCYWVLINASSELSLEVKDMNHCSSKFGLHLLILDKNDNAFEISIDSLDLSKYILICLDSRDE